MALLDRDEDYWFWTHEDSKMEYWLGPFVSSFCECLDCTRQWNAVYVQGQGLNCPFCGSGDTEREVSPGPNYETIH
jgi:hypothetical protein